MTVTEINPPADEGSPGKYRLLVELGEGGTAHVYLAVARGLSGFNKLVVLKALKSSLANDVELRQMFLNEARIAARLNHRNIVQTYEVLEIDRIPVIVMEYLEGQPLSHVFSRAVSERPLPLPMHLKILSEVLMGLHYLHELSDYDGKSLNLVHRDVTPHNVFICFDGQVKLLDFGLAQLHTSQVESESGVLRGKITYMPPEQILGQQIDRRTDLFAVGIMLWEAATGQRMWQDMPDVAIMHAVLQDRIPAPSTVKADVSPELERICMKALAPLQQDRYASALELQRDLEALLSTYTPAPSAPDIGEFAAALFTDVRQRTQEVIEQELSNSSSLRPLNLAEGSLRNSLGAPNSLHPTSLFTEQTVTHGFRPTLRRRVSWLAILALGLLISLLLVGVGGSFRQRELSQVPQVASAPASPLPGTGPTVTQPKHNELIELRVTTVPSSAELFLDNRPLSNNPFAGSMPLDRARHELRAEAPGHSPETITLSFDKNAEIRINLRRSAKTARSPLRTGKAVAPMPSASATPDTSKQCNPPYFMNDQGIKEFKLHCM